MNKIPVILLLLAVGVLAVLYYSIRFEATSRHALPLPASTPIPEERISFSEVANGVSNYLLGVEFSVVDKVPEEIEEKDLAFYEQALRSSRDIVGKEEIASALGSIFSKVRVLRSKLLNAVSKMEKLALMKKGLTDTEESFRERVELRRYNLEKEIGREAEKLLFQIKDLRSEANRLGSTYKGVSLPVSDAFVTALSSRSRGPATRGYPPPLDEAPKKGELKAFDSKVISVSAEGTLAVEIEYVAGRVSRLQSIGGGGGHVPMIAVPGTNFLFIQGLRHGVVEDQRIHVLARRRGDYRYISKSGEQRTVERWNFIRFVNK
jgi:hypothetical protein